MLVVLAVCVRLRLLSPPILPPDRLPLVMPLCPSTHCVPGMPVVVRCCLTAIYLKLGLGVVQVSSIGRCMVAGVCGGGRGVGQIVCVVKPVITSNIHCVFYATGCQQIVVVPPAPGVDQHCRWCVWGGQRITLYGDGAGWRAKAALMQASSLNICKGHVLLSRAMYCYARYHTLSSGVTGRVEASMLYPSANSAI